MRDFVLGNKVYLRWIFYFRFQVGISKQVEFTFGNLKFQREGFRLGFRKGWWESQYLYVNWGCVVESRVSIVDLEIVVGKIKFQQLECVGYICRFLFLRIKRWVFFKFIYIVEIIFVFRVIFLLLLYKQFQYELVRNII